MASPGLGRIDVTGVGRVVLCGQKGRENPMTETVLTIAVQGFFMLALSLAVIKHVFQLHRPVWLWKCLWIED
jgi:hypothetical protein